MDFDKLREVWKSNENRLVVDSEKELNEKLKAITGMKLKIKQYFRFEMAMALAIVICGGAAVYFLGNLEPYFLKLFVLVLAGNLPVAIRLFLSMKSISGIDYTSQLRSGITGAVYHLQATIRIYYVLVVLTVTALVLMSWQDLYFLALPLVWKAGIMSYFLLFLVSSFRLIHNSYGKRLKELRELLESL